jgi:hypothetical protein
LRVGSSWGRQPSIILGLTTFSVLLTHPQGIDSGHVYLDHKHLKEAGPEPEGSLLTYEEIALVLGAASSDTHGGQGTVPVTISRTARTRLTF